MALCSKENYYISNIIDIFGVKLYFYSFFSDMNFKFFLIFRTSNESFV